MHLYCRGLGGSKQAASVPNRPLLVAIERRAVPILARIQVDAVLWVDFAFVLHTVFICPRSGQIYLRKCGNWVCPKPTPSHVALAWCQRLYAQPNACVVCTPCDCLWLWGQVSMTTASRGCCLAFDNFSGDCLLVRCADLADCFALIPLVSSDSTLFFVF